MKYCIALLVLVAACAASVVQRPLGDIPEGWRIQRIASPTSRISTTIRLNSRNSALLSSLVQTLSDPQSPRYGQWLSAKEISEISAPSKESMQAVASFLDGQKVDYVESLDSFVVDSTVEQASKMYTAEFHEFVHTDGSTTVRSLSAVSLPAEVSQHVSAVFGVGGFSLPKRKLAYSNSTNDAAYVVTPAVITKAYKVSGVTPSGSTKNRQAVAEFQGQYMKQSDLTAFFTKYVPNAKSGDDQVFKFVGTNKPGSGTEALLDIEYIMGVAPGIKTEFWEYPGMDFCKDLQQWTTAMLGDDDVPLVHSVSYGWQGDVKQIGCTDAEVTAIDSDFQKLATKGITIIFASGDSGSGESPSANTQKLFPSWPASSPYVTAVGSTRFINQDPTAGEQATDQFGSGSGFSSMFTQPDWQNTSVAHYYSTVDQSTLPDASIYAKGGRGTPDVAALGEGFQVIVGGKVDTVGGTSASAPTFAGLVSLLNEARITAGKASLGYLNPFIYQNAAAFMDVTVGSDKFGRGPFKLKDGFVCTEGWDPVTGFGTPDFSKLLTAVKSLQ